MAKKQVTKRQHTVPKFVLRAFRVDGKANQVVQYDKLNRTSCSVSISNASVVKHCYSFIDGDGQHNDAAERAFSSIESRASPLLLRLSSSSVGELSSADRLAVSHFLALQMKRSAALVSYSQREMKKGVSSRETLLRQLEMSLPKLQKRYDLSEISECRANFTSGDINPESQVKKAWLRTLLESLPNVASILADMNWQVVTACPGSFYVCSDVPAFVRRQEDDSDLGIVGIGRGDLNAQLHMPLSPKRFLVAGHSTLKSRVVASKTRVLELNRRTIRMADRWIYSHSDSAAVGRLVADGSKWETPLPSFRL